MKPLLLSLLLVCVCGVYGVASTHKRPNILFILADDYGWNDIGYHNSEIPTPNLDALAAQGIKLENYYVQPLCTPSRASLMTGRYPIRYGLQHLVILQTKAAGLNLTETTLAQKMKEAGYSTHLLGKWHLGFFDWKYTPTYRGFDSFVGFYGPQEDYDTHSYTYKGFSGYDFRNNTDNLILPVGEFSNTVFEREFKKIINNHVSVPYNERKPFFTYLALQTPHSPLQPPAESLAPCNFITNATRRLYCGLVVNMDLTVANVTRALRDAGIEDDTLIIFSADNGGDLQYGGNNLPLRGAKFNNFEGGVRGVSFIAGAGVPWWKKGTHYNGLMHMTDWFPTLLHVAGGNTAGTLPLDGVDQWSAITKTGLSPRYEVLHNIDEIDKVAAIRLGNWKLIAFNVTIPTTAPTTLEEYLSSFDFADYLFGDDDSENITQCTLENNVFLFNIAADPNEQNNLACENRNIVRLLAARLRFYNKGRVPSWFPDDDPNSNPALRGGYWSPWISS